MQQTRGPQSLRVMQGLLHLAGKHPAADLENVVRVATHHGIWRLGYALAAALRPVAPPTQCRRCSPAFRSSGRTRAPGSRILHIVKRCLRDGCMQPQDSSRSWHPTSNKEGMVQTVLRLAVDSRHRAEFVQALRAMARSARSERGFLSSRVCHKEDDANVFFYEEEWSTAADVEKQICSSRYTELLALMEAAKAQPRIEFRFISEVRGLEYIEDIRLAPNMMRSPTQMTGEAATAPVQSERERGST